MTYILTAIILWLIWWLTPWPIIILSFSEILKSPKKWLSKWWMYVFIAWMTEFFIWLFLITSWKFLAIPSFIFHILSIIWILILLYLSYIIYKIDSISWDKKQIEVWIKHIILLMFFNWPMWLFWLSVCLPESFKLWEVLPYWEYVFVIVFEIFMMLGLAIMLFWFNFFRSFFTNKKIVKNIFRFLAFLIFIIAIKILYWEVNYFFSL